MVTIKQIADAVGVSSATVSRVLNFDSTLSVSAQTRKSIVETAEALNYATPRNRNRKSDQTRLGQKIALVHFLRPDQELVDPYYVGIRLGIESRCNELKLEAMQVYHTDSVPDPALLKAAAGVIVIGLHSGAEIDWVMSHNPNVVFADFSPVGDEHDSVRSDLDLAMRKLLQALDDQGYRRMAFIGWDITSSRSSTSISDRRLPAYQDWMRAKGRYEPDLCRIGDNTEQSGYELTLNLLQSGARPDALITGNDNMAVGAYRAIHESGLKIPGDIAVASFNDIPVAQFLNPPLTTVRLPAEEIGQNAVDLLFEQLSGRSTPKCILLSSRVILRASTRGKGKSGVK